VVGGDRMLHRYIREIQTLQYFLRQSSERVFDTDVHAPSWLQYALTGEGGQHIQMQCVEFNELIGRD
jgi:hypothetical protein